MNILFKLANYKYCKIKKSDSFYVLQFDSYIFIFSSPEESIKINLSSKIVSTDTWNNNLIGNTDDGSIFAVEIHCSDENKDEPKNQSKKIQKDNILMKSDDIKNGIIKIINNKLITLEPSIKISVYDIINSNNTISLVLNTYILLGDYLMTKHTKPALNFHSLMTLCCCYQMSSESMLKSYELKNGRYPTNENHLVISDSLFNYLFNVESNLKNSPTIITTFSNEPVKWLSFCNLRIVNILCDLGEPVVGILSLSIPRETFKKFTIKKQSTDRIIILLIVGKFGKVMLLSKEIIDWNLSHLVLQLPAIIKCCKLLDENLFYSTSDGLYAFHVTNWLKDKFNSIDSQLDLKLVSQCKLKTFAVTSSSRNSIVIYEILACTFNGTLVNFEFPKDIFNNTKSNLTKGLIHKLNYGNGDTISKILESLTFIKSKGLDIRQSCQNIERDLQNLSIISRLYSNGHDCGDSLINTEQFSLSTELKNLSEIENLYCLNCKLSFCKDYFPDLNDWALHVSVCDANSSECKSKSTSLSNAKELNNSGKDGDKMGLGCEVCLVLNSPEFPLTISCILVCTFSVSRLKPLAILLKNEIKSQS